VQSRRALLRSMYPELREGRELTAAIENTLRDQPKRDFHSFVRRVRRALNVTTTHVVSCVEMQERDMSLVERFTSFRGPPTLVMVVRGMCYSDQDQSMAVLSEMVQTGLYTQELLRVLYTHMVPMARTIREHLTAIDNFNAIAESAVLQATIVRLETHTVIKFVSPVLKNMVILLTNMENCTVHFTFFVRLLRNLP